MSLISFGSKFLITPAKSIAWCRVSLNRRMLKLHRPDSIHVPSPVAQLVAWDADAGRQKSPQDSPGFFHRAATAPRRLVEGLDHRCIHERELVSQL